MASKKRDRNYVDQSLDDSYLKKQHKIEERLRSLYEKKTRLIKKIKDEPESDGDSRAKDAIRQERKLTHACGVALEEFYRSRTGNARQFLRGQLRDTIHDDAILLQVLTRFDAIDAETMNNEFALEEEAYWKGN